MGFEIVRLDTCNWPCRRAARPRPSTRACSGSSGFPSPSRWRRRGGCWFGRGEVTVHLGVEVDFRPARKAHPALVVRDLPALEAALGAAGVSVRANSDSEPGRGAYVEDPFGNRIELMVAD